MKIYDTRDYSVVVAVHEQRVGSAETPESGHRAESHSFARPAVFPLIIKMVMRGQPARWSSRHIHDPACLTSLYSYNYRWFLGQTTSVIMPKSATPATYIPISAVYTVLLYAPARWDRRAVSLISDRPSISLFAGCSLCGVLTP